jgi:hypothetical protein
MQGRTNLLIRENNCKNCNKIYIPKSNNSEHCSSSCKFKFYRKGQTYKKKYKEYIKSESFMNTQHKYRTSKLGQNTRKIWYKNNHKKILEWFKKWRKTEKGKRIKNYDCALRYAQKKQRTPKWLNKNELSAIKEFYLQRPKGYEVDHIIPLCGDNVSGLHVLNNLQYLKAEDNRYKNKKFNTHEY